MTASRSTSFRVLKRALSLSQRKPFPPSSSFTGSRLEQLSQTQQWQDETTTLMIPQGQRRTMVVVTKTSVGDTPDLNIVMDNNNNNNISPPSSSVADGSIQDDVIITGNCLNQIRSLVKRRKDGVTLQDIYLRVYVDPGGCSGFQYKFELTKDEDEPIDTEEDKVFESKDGDGARVVIDQTSLELLKGSTIDYVQEMIKSAFSVTHNPQSESACGCGSSFAIKNFSDNPALD
mmetsp:Transcript_3500/g.5066  ORF Transcript_3500/g.5066 Transcript_3500/m.5066 type:complete len:232 (+) Transcript_3500:110-805(+)